MTLGEKCKAKALEILREELEEKMKQELEAYGEHYDHFIKTGECHGINCEDCPFYKNGGIGSELTPMLCSGAEEEFVTEEEFAIELSKEVSNG